ncbi:hypothetical protein JTE90_024119 [Oedothorax gibbosus]|uniref:Phosphoenolpyruvate synthase n=1 Tax=Oedothorax gibbosus TaxID=931172 RepID=A0AAV6USY4_9ARAC|nr:hypothetical protein JTE90_024119 [Oedothorax gibbosus]
MIRSLLVSIFTAPLDFIYWLKWWIAYIGIRLYNACHSKRLDVYDINALGDPVKLGFVVPKLERELESPFPESHLQEAADEVLFYGVNSKSECLLVRVSRGPNQVSDAWIYLKLANGKSYKLTESAGHQQPYEGGKCTNFSCGKLQMHYLAPMRRWRIFYCGMLKETSATKSDVEETVFVKFVFLGQSSSDVYDFTLDSNPTGFADSLARTQWPFPLLPPLDKVVETANFYAQTGVIHGTVSIDDGDDIELYMFGEKMRSLGKTAHVAGCKFTNILGNTPANGFTFHLGKTSAPYIFNNLPYGFVVTPTAFLSPLKEVDINIQPHSDKSERTFEAHISSVSAGSYEVKGHVLGDPIVLYSGQGWNGFAEASFVEFTVGGKQGSGLLLSGEVYKEPRKIEKPILETTFPKIVPLTVPFSDDVSHFGEISGGKGSSLGKLTKLSEQEKSFTVPKGIVVTTAAYQEFLTPEILNAVKHLENVVYGNVNGDVKEACNMVSGIIVRTLLPQKICHSIIEELKQLFGDETNQRKFAVRSSATGEDTSAMSAAGQMDTFLGIQGLKEIFLAVKKCWASQFGHIAVEYKKRYGQPLNCPMAVVIQEMVSSQVSGVLFTCDPVTNNPDTVTITANYGLGETVVSGSVEPDTITLKRDVNGELQFDSCLVGAKHQKLVLQESGGTVTEDIPEESRGQSCLSKDLAERLGKLSLKIEKYYRSSRDIEWGIVNGNIYILQSRPVSNASAETEFEIKHELDAPMRCEGEYFTVANVGEVMPGATSPLGIDVITKYFSNVIKRQALEKGFSDNLLQSKYFPTGLLVFCNHVMLTVVEMVCRYGVDTPISKGFMISIFGRILDDPEMLTFAREKMPPGVMFKPNLQQRIQNWKDFFFHDWSTEKVKRKLEKYHSNFLKHKTAKETFAAIMKSSSDFDEGVNKHMNSTESSSNWNMSLFKILSEANGGNFNSDVYSDFARLLATSSNVESANVPQAMQEVALRIVEDIGSEKFKSMPVEDALKYLQKSTSQAGCKFRQFIKRHGHRCLKEFDMFSITWGMDSKLLVKLLQNLSEVVKEGDKKDVDDYNKLYSELHVPLGFISKLKLRFVLPNCRKAVRGREAGKSLTIKSLDHWRQGYRRLAKQMVAEGRIPDEDVLFFMSIDEIKQLLETRSPTIIARALSRKKVFPTLEVYKFPEIMRGIPKPVNDNDTFEYVADLTMKGIPVSQGLAKGYARVAMNLEEASHLQKGEILITYSTDIGWSPYFPIISGVVTELGGLISHGAVVSREYGLPCVVGLQGATKRFQTGDYVLLDGKKGILQRLPKPEK